MRQLKEFGGHLKDKLCEPGAQFWHIAQAEHTLTITDIAVVIY